MPTGRVIELNLRDNNLQGTLPAQLARLTKLSRLYLWKNQLTGLIPTELARLSKLTKLHLAGNAGLLGPLPPSFTDLTPETLDLSGTGVCVPLTVEFAEWLDVIPTKRGIVHCPDPDPEALSALYKLTNGPNWKNKDNWLSSAPLGEWYGVTTDAYGRVAHLNLRDNNLSGFLPSSLSSLANLKELDLADNAALSGPLPLALTRLPIESLDLEGTRLCAPPRAEFRTWLDGIGYGDVSRCTDTRPDFYALVALYSGTDGPKLDERRKLGRHPTPGPMVRGDHRWRRARNRIVPE